MPGGGLAARRLTRAPTQTAGIDGVRRDLLRRVGVPGQSPPARRSPLRRRRLRVPGAARAAAAERLRAARRPRVLRRRRLRRAPRRPALPRRLPTTRSAATPPPAGRADDDGRRDAPSGPIPCRCQEVERVGADIETCRTSSSAWRRWPSSPRSGADAARGALPPCRRTTRRGRGAAGGDRWRLAGARRREVARRLPDRTSSAARRPHRGRHRRLLSDADAPRSLRAS